MLSIHFGRMYNGKEVVSVDPFFDRKLQQKDLITDDLAREILLDVEGTKVINRYIIDSKYLGVVSAEKISSGVKALLLMKNYPDIVVCASRCGDNCAKWIQRIGMEQDITIVLLHLMEFKDPFEAYCMNSGKMVHSYKEYSWEYFVWDKGLE